MNFHRQPISLSVMITFVVMLWFWASQASAAPTTETNSQAKLEQGENGSPKFFEQESAVPAAVKKVHKFPWLLMGAAVVIAAAVVYLLIIKKPKYSLTVDLGAGTTGIPAATANFKKGTSIPYDYSSQAGYSGLQVKLDGVAVPACGTVSMNSDHTIAVSAFYGATVNISSRPGGAKVFDNFIDTGKTTDTRITYDAGGNHTYLLRRCGYQDYRDTRSVMCGQTSNISMTLLPGILDDFLVSPTCWVPYASGNWTAASGQYRCRASLSNWNFSYYDSLAAASTYTVEVRMKRVLGSLTRSNAMILATGSNMTRLTGYLFNYSADGWYSLWKISSKNLETDLGTSSAMRSWTPSPHVKKNLGAWNVLKIVRSGSAYSFYMNDFHVWSFTHDEYDPHYLVLASYCDNTQVEMAYDYVKLTTGASTGLRPGETVKNVPLSGEKDSQHASSRIRHYNWENE